MTSVRPYLTDGILDRVTRELANELMGISDMPWDECRQHKEDRVTKEILSLRGHVYPRNEEISSILSERLHYTNNDEIDELFEGFPAKIAARIFERIVAWVKETQPKPPFEDFAYVRITPEEARTWGHPSDCEGIAVRSDDLDRSAYARFIPRQDHVDFIESIGRRGSGIVAWEGIESARPIADGIGQEAVKWLRWREGDLRPSLPDPVMLLARRPALPRALEPKDFRKPILETMNEVAIALKGSDEDAAHDALTELQSLLGHIATMRREGRVRLTDEEEPRLYWR